MTDARQVIRRPIMTEKSTRGTEMGKYTFEVAGSANKLTIKRAVEDLFDVTVARVNTMTIPGRMRRRGQYWYRSSGYKKAVVTLVPGQKIDLENLT